MTAAARSRRPLRDLLRRRLPELKHTVRVAVGTMAAFALYTAFDLPQGYWAVFTVVIVMQGSVGGTVGVAVDRLLGTVAGALVGGAAAALRGPGPEALGWALAVSVAATSLLAAVRPSMKVAPVTAAIMLLSATGALTPVQAAGFRVAEIALGSVIAVAATLLIFPSRSRAAVAGQVTTVVALLAARLEELADAAEAGTPCPEVGARDALRIALSELEAAMVDAERQRTAFLGDHGVPQAILRGLWRLRSDGIYVGRALVQPLEPAAHARLGAPAAADLRAEAGLIRACAAALAENRVVARADPAGAHPGFLAAFDALRAAGETKAMGFAEAGRVFGLAFALETLARNVADLVQRVDETALGRADPAPPAAPMREAPADGQALRPPAASAPP